MILFCIFALKYTTVHQTLVIDFQHIDIFQQEEKVLGDVNLALAKAETCYIIGKSGSGKTSLLKTIYGSLPLKNGYATVSNFNLSTLKDKEIPILRRKIGMVFQDFNLFLDWTVGKNLWYILEATGWRDRELMTKRVLAVLEMVGLEGFEKKVAGHLSGGQMQRVVIARALLNNPEIIIADEPTGNLDPDTSDEILYLLNRLSREFGTSIIIATHDYRLIQKFPARVFKCENDRFIEV